MRRGLKEAGGKPPAQGSRTSSEAGDEWASLQDKAKPLLSKTSTVNGVGAWRERARNYPGRPADGPTKSVTLLRINKQRLNRQESADGIVPEKKKQGRPEHRVLTFNW